MSKRVVKKSASPRPKKSVSGERVHPDALTNPEVNDTGLDKTPSVHAKVVTLIVSVDTSDKERDWETWVSDIKKSLGAVEPPWIDKKGKRKPGPHVAATGGYYILDGKVCLPEDYDKKKKTFKKGATPPEWAGGPKKGGAVLGSIQKQMDWDMENLSSDEYDKKYGIGKYAPKPRPVESSAAHDARMRAEREARRLAEEESLEVLDFDEDDVYDDDKMGAIADESASAAIKKMQGSKKRVVKKKPATPKKRTVKRRG